MTRFMYDSVNPGAIPSSATMVAGYADGRYANLPAMKARFPHATVVSIAVRWTTRAQVLDVETGDATPAEAVAWCTKTMADKPNGELTVYCNTSVWPAVRAAFKAAGVTEPQYWVGHYDGIATVPAGAVAKQYLGDYHGYDKSVVADHWPCVDPDSPAPKPQQGAPQWQQLLNHVLSIPERVYETWTSAVGWNNTTEFGKEYGEDGVSWCVIWDWDMFHDVGLDAVVPKTDNVTAFSNWAKSHGQWSEYPSVGSWVNFGNGAHTEIVIGFDQQSVYTKGGNSIEAGATDGGQGNGVWRHSRARTDSYITGYFAPRFPDGHCPPTADPHDPRGGAAQTSYTPPEDDVQLNDQATAHKGVWTDKDQTATVEQWLTLGNLKAGAAADLAAKTLAGITATNAAIAALAKLIGTNTDPAEVERVVQQAIADAVVHVQVDVTGPTA